MTFMRTTAVRGSMQQRDFWSGATSISTAVKRLHCLGPGRPWLACPESTPTGVPFSFSFSFHFISSVCKRRPLRGP